MTRLTDAYTTALCQAMAPSLEREATCDEPEWDRGPVPEVSESSWAEFDALRNVGKGERWHQKNDAAASDLDRLDAMRRAGL